MSIFTITTFRIGFAVRKTNFDTQNLMNQQNEIKLFIFSTLRSNANKTII
jgi:hypothetical protein